MYNYNRWYYYVVLLSYMIDILYYSYMYMFIYKLNMILSPIYSVIIYLRLIVIRISNDMYTLFDSYILQNIHDSLD